MKTDPGQIPSSLFEWLETADFDSLDAAQQMEVLLHFSMEEYNELRTTVTALKRDTSLSGMREQRKKEIMDVFDEVHKPEAVVHRFRPVWILRIAASVLFFVAGWVCYSLIKRNEPQPEKILAVADTVYVTKEIATLPEKIHDTVYIERKTKNDRNTSIAHPDQKPFYEQGSGPSVIPVESLESSLNSPKRNSLKDDSLAKRFSSVTL